MDSLREGDNEWTQNVKIADMGDHSALGNGDGISRLNGEGLSIRDVSYSLIVLVSFNSIVRVPPGLMLDGHWGSTLIPPAAATPAPFAIKASANMDAILTFFFVFLDTDIFVSSFLFSGQKIENLAINLFFYCQSFLVQNSENCRFSAGLPDKKYHKYKNCSIYGAMALV